MALDRITKLLEDIRFLGEERFNLVQALREGVFSLADSISEEIKYGGILFPAGKLFCGVFSYSKHVSLEFRDGTSGPDSHNVLQGEGKLRRHIKLLSQEDIATKHVHEYLALAFKTAGEP